MGFWAILGIVFAAAILFVFENRFKNRLRDIWVGMAIGLLIGSDTDRYYKYKFWWVMPLIVIIIFLGIEILDYKQEKNGIAKKELMFFHCMVVL